MNFLFLTVFSLFAFFFPPLQAAGAPEMPTTETSQWPCSPQNSIEEAIDRENEQEKRTVAEALRKQANLHEFNGYDTNATIAGFH